VIDRRHIGYRTQPFAVEVELGRLRLFAQAIGETDPIYRDLAAARMAGFRSLPVPPTFFFCLEMERPDPYDWFKELGIPLARALHGEQSFTYHRIACAGEVLRFAGEVTDIYDKKAGALEFIVQRVTVSALDDEPIAIFDRTVVIRNS
jgi:hypothetical protein